jgi:hypothetical protein
MNDEVENQETLALLALLKMGQKAYNEGKFSSAEAFFAKMDQELLGRKNEE